MRRTALGNWTISWTEPGPADVIRYSYLWRDQARRGEDAGRKDRPCLVLATRRSAAGLRVLVAPFTTSGQSKDAVPVPPKVARHLGLDAAPRIVCSDLNIFIWVGPDVRVTASGTPFYGQVPARLFEEVRARVHANAVPPTARSR